MNWSLASIPRDGANAWGNQTALIDGPLRLTFAELEIAASALAATLLANGVAPGDRVAIAGERDANTVVAIFGTSLTGAIYVPMDPKQPPDRLQLLLYDVGARILIGPRELQKLADDTCGLEFIEISGLANLASITPPAAMPELPEVPSCSLAYIMFTSGSTGLPKGVQIEHRGIRAFFDTHNERAAIGPGDRCLNSGPFYFDVSVMDVLLPLYMGATVVFAGALPIPTLMLEAIEKHSITHFYAVGTLLGLITGDGRRLDRHDLGSLRVLATGAEVCNVRVVNEWLSRYPTLRFLNSYGPTEVTVGCISFLKPDPGPILEQECPIGIPHRDTLALLIDGDGVLTEVGKVGELILAGPQLMRGYWQRSIEDRRAWISVQGKTFYRTGDYAFIDERGNFRFVGRLDEEVKLHGHRIHLNEVRRSFQTDSRVEYALAGTIEGTDAERELVVALLTKRAHNLHLARDLVRRAERTLPSAMRPTRLVLLQTLPRLPSGKADRDKVLQWVAAAVRLSDQTYYSESSEKLRPLE